MPISSSSSSFGIVATSSAVRPRTISVSIDVAAWLIAQPRPSNPTSSIMSPSKRTRDRHLVAAQRVLALRDRVGGLEQPVVPRAPVVIEDHFPVQLLEFAHDAAQPSFFLTCWRPVTSRSISSGTV